MRRRSRRGPWMVRLTKRWAWARTPSTTGLRELGARTGLPVCSIPHSTRGRPLCGPEDAIRCFLQAGSTRDQGLHRYPVAGSGTDGDLR
jgi:hypothetical protein